MTFFFLLFQILITNHLTYYYEYFTEKFHGTSCLCRHDVFAIGFALGINSFPDAGIRTVTEMSASESNLPACRHVLISIPNFLVYRPPNVIKPSVYKKQWLSFIIFRDRFDYSSKHATESIIVWFLFASFICGAIMEYSKRPVNPYVTILDL